MGSFESFLCALDAQVYGFPGKIRRTSPASPMSPASPAVWGRDLCGPFVLLVSSRQRRQFVYNTTDEVEVKSCKLCQQIDLPKIYVDLTVLLDVP